MEELWTVWKGRGRGVFVVSAMRDLLSMTVEARVDAEGFVSGLAEDSSGWSSWLAVEVGAAERVLRACKMPWTSICTTRRTPRTS